MVLEHVTSCRLGPAVPQVDEKLMFGYCLCVGQFHHLKLNMPTVHSKNPPLLTLPSSKIRIYEANRHEK